MQPTPAWLDEQSSHGTLRAGLAYARGLEEAPGHVESARGEYRALSREWYAFLGFGTYLGRRETKLQVSAASGETIIRPICGQKRRRDSLEGVY